MDSWEALVRAYPLSEFDSPRRSTIPLLDFWRDGDSATSILNTTCGLSLSGPSLHFEHQTPVHRGVGKASHTDLMITDGQAAVAVEAKFTEPPYNSVQSWLGNEPTPNRKDVLAGWLSLIADATSCALTPDQLAESPYQLIHRTAAVCSVNAEARYVLYHLFAPDADSYYRGHLSGLATSLASSKAVSFLLIETEVRPTEECSGLERRLVRGEQSQGAIVRDSLLNSPLYKFGQSRLVQLA